MNGTPERWPLLVAAARIMNQPTLFDEAKRLSKADERLLARLRTGPATNVDLVPVCGLRSSARVHDLRQCGFQIKAEHVRGGVWLYTLSE